MKKSVEIGGPIKDWRGNILVEEGAITKEFIPVPGTVTEIKVHRHEVGGEVEFTSRTPISTRDSSLPPGGARFGSSADPEGKVFEHATE